MKKTGKEIAIGAAVASLLMGGTALASDLFKAKELKSGYQLASHHEEHGEKKCKSKDCKHDKKADNGDKKCKSKECKSKECKGKDGDKKCKSKECKSKDCKGNEGDKKCNAKECKSKDCKHDEKADGEKKCSADKKCGEGSCGSKEKH